MTHQKLDPEGDTDDVVLDENPDPVEEIRPSLLPVWFEAGIVVVTAALVSVTGVGLLLAFLGRYGLASALLWGLLGTVLFAGVALRGILRRREGRVATWPTVAALAVALASALFNGLKAGHYVFVDRDPGVYAVAARWLARTGTLRVQGGAPWIPASGVTNYASAGMYPEPGGFLEFQFNHLFAVLLAVAQGLGGDRVMFAANALVGAVGLLMVYAVGVRLCRRPWLVVAAVAGLALTLPELLFSRDTYSEPFTQLLLWGAMWLVLTAWERRSLGIAALAGLTLGATVMVRVDALLYLGALPAVAALVFLASEKGSGRRFAAAWAGVIVLFAIPPAVMGSIDVQERAGGYYAALKSSVDGLRLLVVASIVVGVVLVLASRIPGLAGFVGRVRERFAVGAGVAVTLILVLVWALRPALQHPVGVSNTTTAALQQAEGIPVNPQLTYSENSMTWFTWYLGPVTVALAVIGLGLLTAAAVRGRSAALLVIATTGPASALYLYAVSNTPEQVWAMRRYVPAVFPLFVLAAVIALEAIVGVVRFVPWRPDVLRRSVIAVAVAGFVLFPLGVLGPVRDFETQSGFLPALDDACTTITPNAAVVFVYPDIDGIVLTQTMRSYCGVPTTRFTMAAPTADQLQTVKAAANAQGRTLWILGSTQQGVQTALGTGGPASTSPIRVIGQATDDRKLETTLTRIPDAYASQSLSIWAAKVG